MQAKYHFCARATGRRARALMDEFVGRFGNNATSIERWDIAEIVTGDPDRRDERNDPKHDYLGVNMVVPFDPLLKEAGTIWAAEHPEVEFRDDLNRDYTPKDCKAAPLCMLSFPNCYIYPQEFSWRPCPGCPGDRPEATGDVANRIQQKKGIGESHGRLLVNKAMAAEIGKAKLKGFDVVPWTGNRRYFLIEPRCCLREVLLQGHNVFRLESATCFGCGRPKFEYLAGPEIVDESRYDGEDIVRMKSAMCQVPQTWMDSYAFSQLAAQFFVKYLKVAKYWQPVYFRSSNLPVLP
jgi:hypothetical protein